MDLGKSGGMSPPPEIFVIVSVALPIILIHIMLITYNIESSKYQFLSSHIATKTSARSFPPCRSLEPSSNDVNIHKELGIRG